MTAFTEIKAKESFHNLHENVKNCQNKETLLECKTRNYLKTGLDRCKCVPYTLRNYSNMVFKNFHSIPSDDEVSIK